MTKSINNETSHGLVIYKILENGNLLNGMCISTSKLPYEIGCGIAQKDPEDNKGIEGTYKAKYIEATSNSNEVANYELKIKKVDSVYEFVWSDDTREFFKGIGMKVDNDHIAVSYSNSTNPIRR